MISSAQSKPRSSTDNGLEVRGSAARLRPSDVISDPYPSPRAPVEGIAVSILPAYGCVADGEPVFLDTGRDRYFAVCGEARDQWRRWLEKPDLLQGFEQTELLQELGVSADQRNGGTMIGVVSRPAPHADLSSTVNGQVPVGRRFEALAMDVLASRLLRRRPLLSVLSNAQGRKLRSISHPDASFDLVAASRAFAWINRLRSANDRCLARSLAFFMMASNHGRSVDLVIGVRMKPFGAHCWVESDNVVLNDDLESVQEYTPILVI